MKKLSIVIPVYQSEKSLPILIERLHNVILSERWNSEIVLVDDCSKDNSWQMLRQLKKQYGELLKIAHLLVNSGQHNALLCGFSLATGDIVVTMDDDLQNPPEEIAKLVQAVQRGHDLVIAAYEKKQHSAVRNLGGWLIDSAQRWVFHLPTGFQLTSFRAARAPVVREVLRMEGAFPYVTSMLLANASRPTNVLVRHDVRLHGQSNYSVRKSLSLAINLLFYYSSLPLYFLAAACGFSLLFSFLMGAWAVYKGLTTATVPGWASTLASLSFFNSLMQASLLALGVYVARFHRLRSGLHQAYKLDEQDLS